MWRKIFDCDDRRDGAYYNGFNKIFVMDGAMTKAKIVKNINHLMNKNGDIEYDII